MEEEKQINEKDQVNENEEPKITEQTSDVKETKGLSWEELNLRESTVKGIIQKGWLKPSPVQEETIPIIKNGNHVIARSKNGTGKTAAFLIPVIDQIDESFAKVQGLILVPTRELALQTERVIKEIAHFTKIKTMVSTGGTSVKDDILKLQKPVHLGIFNIIFYYIITQDLRNLIINYF